MNTIVKHIKSLNSKFKVILSAYLALLARYSCNVFYIPNSYKGYLYYLLFLDLSSGVAGHPNSDMLKPLATSLFCGLH
jgi:hypothetical protein